MREIKFRGIAKIIHEWHGFNKQSHVNDGDLVVGFYLKDVMSDEDSDKFIHASYIRIEYGDHYTDIEIDPETLGQPTGLKDKNGKEIYEGDLIHNPMDDNYCYPVVWNSEHASFGLGNLGDDESLKPYQIPEFWVVIGNIYENPDLLGDSNE